MSIRMGNYLLAAIILGMGAGVGQAAEQETGALMEIIDQAGLGESFLDPLRVRLSGHVEGSYRYGSATGPGNRISGQAFDFESEDPPLNQLTLAIERSVEPGRDTFDLGGRLEWIYGADARKMHSTGLLDYFGDDPENQFDLLQAYVDLAIPWGNGMRLRLGKFVTPLGYEVIDPAGNWLYSHSYLFGAIAFTHTGATLLYAIDERWTLEGGVCRGWDDALEDKNDAMDLLGRVAYQANPQTSLQLVVSTGPERAGNNGIWRTALDGIINHQVCNELSVGGEGLWVIDGDLGSAWYGIAGYAQYRPGGNRYIALNLRVEWFADESGGVYGTMADLYEITLGLGITPFPGDRFGQYLIIRPEIRGDYASEAFFGEGAEHFQFTAALDAVYSF